MGELFSGLGLGSEAGSDGAGINEAEATAKLEESGKKMEMKQQNLLCLQQGK